MIKVDGITKRFGSFTALDDVSFEVGGNEVVGFLGPNGAGKTTTMRILACFIAANEGSASVAGFDVEKQSLDARRSVGYMPESVPVQGEMRVSECLRFRARLKGISRAERKTEIPRIMELTGIADVERKLAGALSKGYRQRLGLALALLGSPKVLILDEPTIGLDPNQVRTVRELIRSLGKAHSVLLSSHILPEVEAVADRVVVINKGKVAAIDSPANLRSRLKMEGKVLLEIKGDAGKAEKALRSIAGVSRVEKGQAAAGGVVRFSVFHVSNELVTEAIFKKMVECGAVITEMRREEASLEEIFARLTGGEAER